MDIEGLILALNETIEFLHHSQDSAPGSLPVDEVIRKLEAEVARAKNLRPIDVILLDHLFAPTGVIQKISIENGWGTKFLRLSAVIDQFTGYAP